MINFQANQQEIKYISMQIVHIDHTVWNSVLLSRTPNKIKYRVTIRYPGYFPLPPLYHALKIGSKESSTGTLHAKDFETKKGQRKLVFFANDAQNGA